MNLDAQSVARLLRGRPAGAGYICRCPVPTHGKGRRDQNPSLGVSDGQKGLVVHCFARCDPTDILTEIARLADANSPLPYDHSPAPSLIKRRTTSEWALRLWRSAVPTPNTPAETYLRARGFSAPPPPTIRFLPYYYYDRSRSFPCLIAAVQAPTREIVAVQLTFLHSSGRRKADVPEPRRAIGPLGAGALRLGPPAQHLGIAEGFETAWAAMLIHGVTVWAALGADRLPLVALPEITTRVTVFADPDPIGLSCARAFASERPEIHTDIQTPHSGEGDYADLWRHRADI